MPDVCGKRPSAFRFYAQKYHSSCLAAVRLPVFRLPVFSRISPLAAQLVAVEGEKQGEVEHPIKTLFSQHTKATITYTSHLVRLAARLALLSH